MPGPFQDPGIPAACPAAKVGDGGEPPSPELLRGSERKHRRGGEVGRRRRTSVTRAACAAAKRPTVATLDAVLGGRLALSATSEERRVGKECVRTSRYRWSKSQ